MAHTLSNYQYMFKWTISRVKLTLTEKNYKEKREAIPAGWYALSPWFLTRYRGVLQPIDVQSELIAIIRPRELTEPIQIPRTLKIKV